MATDSIVKMCLSQIMKHPLRFMSDTESGSFKLKPILQPIQQRCEKP